MMDPQRPFPPLQPCFLACLSLLLLITMAGCAPAEEVVDTMKTDRMNADLKARPLPPESPVDASLGEGEVHRYAVSVPRGQATRLRVEQKQQDVWLEVGDEERRVLLSVDSPTGDTGTESVLLLAEDGDGRFLVDVHVFEGASPEGGYRIESEAHRPITETLRTLRDAEWARSKGHAYDMLSQGSPAEARQHFREAVEGFRALQEEGLEGETANQVESLLAESLFHLGRLTERSRQHDPANLEAALALFEEAEAMERRRDSTERLVTLLNKKVGTQLSLYRIEGTLETARESVELARRLDDPAFLAAALERLGDATEWHGERSLALEAWEEALKLYGEIPGRADQEARLHLRLGRHFLRRQAADEAAHHLERARELTSPDEDRISDPIHLALADLASLRARQAARRGDSPKPHLERALEGLLDLLESSPRGRQRAGVLTQLGTVHLQADRPSLAAEHFAEAMEIYRDLPGADHDEAMSRHQRGRALFREGRFEEALEHHLQAAEDLGPDHSQGRVSALYAQARALFHLGRLREAEEILESLVQDAESLRNDSRGVSLRQAYVASRRHYWELYVATLVRRHGRSPSPELAARALEVATRAQARGLLDLVMESVAEVRQETAPSALRERSRVVAQLERLERELLDLPETDGEEAAAQLERRRQDLLAQLERIEREISARSGRVVLQTEPLTVEEIRSRVVEPGTLLLSYFIGEEASSAWLLTEDHLEMVQLPPRRELEGDIRAYTRVLPRRAPGSREILDRAGRRLSRHLLKPYEQHLEGERLLVVADGALHGLPFGALPLPEGAAGVRWNQEDTLLVDRFQVTHLPSPAVLTALRRREEERVRKEGARPGRGPLLAVVANPDFGSTAAPRPGNTRAWSSIRDLEPLPFSAREAEGLVELVGDPDRTLQALGTEANRQLFEGGRLTPYPIVHIATHAHVDTEHPELSTLVLSDRDADGRPRPALLQLYELYELQLPAQLVVLSACRTARGEPVRGEGMVGLTRGFLHAGASRVVHSLWDVDDQATQELMVGFYEGLLRQGLPPAAALRQAQNDLRSSRPEPYFWAGFVLTGDWRPLPVLAGEGAFPDLGDEDIGQKFTGTEDPPPPPPEDDDLPAPVQPVPRVPPPSGETEAGGAETEGSGGSDG